MATMHSYGAARAGAAAPADEPPIDLTHLFRMTLGDHSLEREVLALFDRQIDMLIERMGEVDPSCVGALAHTLKGSARAIGAVRVTEAAEWLEIAMRDDASASQALALKALAATPARCGLPWCRSPSRW